MISERCKIFGGLFDIERPGGGWSELAAGNDGKRLPAHFVIPEFAADDELEQFLFDLFHEQAGCKKGGIFRVQR